MPKNRPDNTGKPVRLADSLLAGPDELVVICIPEFYRDVLLSLTDRVFWNRAWGRPLTEEEVSRLEYAVWRLSQEECDMEITVNPTITINNNDTVGGGGGDCGCTTPPPWQEYPWPGGTQCYPAPQTPEPDPDTNPPIPPDDTPPSEWDVFRCKLANYAYDQILVWLTKVSQVPNNLLTIGAILALMWAWLPASLLALAGGAILELATLVWQWYAMSEGLDEVAEYAVTWWTDHKEEIICKFYNMTDVAETRDSILAEFLEDLAVFAESRPWWFEEAVSWLDQFTQKAMPFNIFLAPWRLVPPTGYSAHTSCVCADGEGPSQVEGEWWLVPVPQESWQNEVVDFVNAGSGSVDYVQATWTMTPLTTSSFHEVGVIVEDLTALIERMNTAFGAEFGGGAVTELHGFYVEHLTTWLNPQDRFGYSNGAGGAGGSLAVFGKTVGIYNSTTYGAEAEYAAFIDSLDEIDSYGSAPMNDVKASFGLNTYGTSGALVIRCKVWYIAKVE